MNTVCPVNIGRVAALFVIGQWSSDWGCCSVAHLFSITVGYLNSKETYE